jgi:hypothetical protein
VCGCYAVCGYGAMGVWLWVLACGCGDKSRCGVPPPSSRCRYAQEIDLFVDTNLVTAHSTAADALWSGVPVVVVSAPTMLVSKCRRVECAVLCEEHIFLRIAVVSWWWGSLLWSSIFVHAALSLQHALCFVMGAESRVQLPSSRVGSA